MSAVAVLVVRDGVLPRGADEAAAEAGGAAVLVGGGVAAAAGELSAADRVWLAEFAPVTPGALAAALAPWLRPVPVVVLPASPDGRDLAPRLAVELDRPLLAGAVRVRPDGAELPGPGGVTDHTVPGPFVATLLPGVRGAEPAGVRPETTVLPLSCPRPPRDPRVLEILRAGEADLAEAGRVLVAGAGVGGPDGIALLGRVAAALGAAVGGTRVVTDAGWLPPDRQIGSTGVSLDPQLCLAFGVSGAAQHVAGLGRPRHLVSVNTDPSCALTSMAGLGLVTDAPALLAELARRLPDGDRP